MRANWFKCLVLSTAMLGLFAAAPATAHAPLDPTKVGDVSLLIRSAKLIVQGKVTKVQYVNATQQNGLPVPHVFVTYAITKVLLPAKEARRTTVTLRFVGGPDGQGRFLDVTGVPRFMVGDEDLLFITDNGEKTCALVMCEFGRYRFLDGLVYESHGAPVIRTTTKRITTSGNGPAALRTFSYPAPTFDELIKNPSAQARLKRLGLTLDEAKKRYLAEAPAELTLTDDFGAPRLAEKFGADGSVFVATIANAIAALTLPAPDPVVDADPAKPFTFAPLVDAQPGK